MQSDIYDFIAVGLGPFNLSLAALSAPIPEVRALFLERQPAFNWHPGILVRDATLQNPFLADLVSLADPRSEYSYLNYCKQTGRIYSCYMRENFYLSRAEYNRYCQWVVARLPDVRLHSDVQKIMYDPDSALYLVSGNAGPDAERFTYRCRKLVLGLGTVPSLPAFCNQENVQYPHTADYLRYKYALQKKRDITIIGSGQSAAEVMYDLLRESEAHDYRLTWITRAPRFFQMENARLTLELISPDYTDYFFDLPPEKKETILRQQSSLYKGINATLINDIYDLLDEKIRAGDTRHTLATNAELIDCRYDPPTDRYHLDFRHVDHNRHFSWNSDGLVLGTGYRPCLPTFLHPIRDRIHWSADQQFCVARNYSVDRLGTEIFVQNAGLRSHGVTNPDLGFCCHRNSRILRELTGREYYKIEQRTALQYFRPPPSRLPEAPLRHPSRMASDHGGHARRSAA